MSHIKSIRKGFTLIELLVVISIIALLLGILVPVLAAAKKSANKTLETANLSSTFKALATYANSNKEWYPGLSSTGKYASDDFLGQKYGAAKNATSVAETTSGSACSIEIGTNMAMAILLEEDSVAPKLIVSPGETNASTAGAFGSVPFASAPTITQILPDALTTKVGGAGATAIPGTPTTDGVMSADNVSFAFLRYGSAPLKAEWKGTTSNGAITLGTRMVFAGVAPGATAGTAAAGSYSSTWTDDQSGKWEGSLVHNDGEATQEKFNSNGQIADSFKNLKYGSIVAPAVAQSGTTACSVFGKSNTSAASEAANFGHATTDTAATAKGKIGSAND